VDRVEHKRRRQRPLFFKQRRSGIPTTRLHVGIAVLAHAAAVSALTAFAAAADSKPAATTVMLLHHADHIGQVHPRESRPSSVAGRVRPLL
jgi:hypothetical protein